MRRIKGLLFIALLLSLLALSADRTALAEAADDLSELRKEVEALKQGQLQLQRELQEINALLRRRQPVTDVQNVVLTIDGYPSKGSQSARLILIEFTDYQCPFCGRHFQQTSPQIDRDYVNTGRVRHIIRDFPIESIHKDALKAAEAAHCAGEQGQYWQMHERLFKSQNALTADHLSAYAGALGLDVQSFKQCLDSNKYAVKIRQDLAEAQKLGVQATPSFLLGVAESGGLRVRVLKLISGAHPYPVFKGAIDSLLSGDGPAAPRSGNQ
jgi:protein-disulfide isomerase